MVYVRMKSKKYDRLTFMILAFLVCVSIFSTIKYFKYEIMEIWNLSYREMFNINLNEEELEEYKESINIIDLNLKFEEGLEYKNNPIVLIYHHAAVDEMSVEQIHEFHKEKGWSGIGYNYYVRKDGRIFEGRPEEAEGAHTIGRNSSSLGICLEGNFEEEEVTEEQKESLENLSLYLLMKYDIVDIKGHRDFYETLCPGENFNVREEKEKVLKKLEAFSY